MLPLSKCQTSVITKTQLLTSMESSKAHQARNASEQQPVLQLELEQLLSTSSIPPQPPSILLIPVSSTLRLTALQTKQDGVSTHHDRHGPGLRGLATPARSYVASVTTNPSRTCRHNQSNYGPPWRQVAEASQVHRPTKRTICTKLVSYDGNILGR